jgi:NAD(P)-dependent dehydrogenase (short-subunit alcohol dehydrogenase family)
MNSALVIGASGGIGGAIAHALRERGVEVTGLSRSADGLDVSDEASIEAALGRLDGPFDLIFVATGKLDGAGHPPEKSISAVTPEALMDQFRVNAMGPILLLKHALPLIPKDRPATFAVLSARVGSIGDNAIGGWHSYRAAKAALNQLIHGAAIELRRTRRQACAVCLHPGTVHTAFTAPYAGRHATVDPAEAAARLIAVIDGLRPEHSGLFLDYHGREIPW